MYLYNDKNTSPVIIAICVADTKPFEGCIASVTFYFGSLTALGYVGTHVGHDQVVFPLRLICNKLHYTSSVITHKHT